MSPDFAPSEPAGAVTRIRPRASGRRKLHWWTLLLPVLCFLTNQRTSAVTLWSDPGSTLVFENGAGRDVLGGAVKRDDFSNDTLYFKFHIDPQSDSSTEEYYAGVELYEGDAERLGIGNALKAWAYSAFVKPAGADSADPAPGYVDLHSASTEPSEPNMAPGYELPRRGVERTIVFKVQYVAGGDDLVTVWLNPDLSSGANEVSQLESLTTRFNANASFDELRLRHGGGGSGWVFSGLAVATSFSDFVDTSSAKPASPATDINFSPQRLSFQSWRREPGMPRNAIRALAQTRDGYLWLGGEDSVSRFDGARFVNFDLGLPARGNRVQSMLGDSHGDLWIGTGAGLVHYTDGEFVSITSNNGLPTNSVTSLTEDAEGRLWIGTTTGLTAWRDGKRDIIPGTEKLQDRRITALCRDSSDTIWIGVADEGVFRFKQGALEAVTDHAVDSLLRQSHCLLADRSGRIWIGAGDDSVLCRENDQWRRFRIPGHTATPYISCLAEQPDGTVWAGSTSEGLFQFKRGKLTTLNVDSGLPDNRVTGLLVDRDGGLWISSDTEVSRLRRTHLFAVGQNEGLGFGAVRGLAEVAPGVIWAVKPNDGLYRWEGRSFNRLTAAGLGVRDASLGAMLVASDGSCWVACTNGVLLYRDPQALSDESRLLALTNVSITSLAEGAADTIWAGTREAELWRLKRGTWTRSAKLSTTNAITALLAETNGAVWIGTGSGLFRWDGVAAVRFGKTNGLVSEVIRTLYRDVGGSLWIGTAGGGLSRWRDGRITTFTTQQGLPENTVSQILEDDGGRLWLGGDHGIVPVLKRDLESKSPMRLNTIFQSPFDRIDRNAAEACSTGFSPAGLKTRSGLLWFSSDKGVVVADPQQLPPRVAMPAVILEEVLVDGQSAPKLPVPSSSGRRGSNPPAAVSVRIPPGRHQVEVHYSSPQFESPEQMRFRYQLEGLDADWIDAGERRTAFYNYVPPGDYRFRVAASNGGDLWSESGMALPLAVSRHFWQRWWVIVLAAVTLLVAVGAVVRYVEKRKAQRRLKRLEQERALERERHRIAQDLHDEMGAKLCHISFLSEHAKRNGHAQEALREQIHTIADESRGLLHTLDEIVWAVNPQNDTLEHVASYINQYAQNYFQNTGIVCELDMPDQFAPYPVSSQARHHLFLAVHEAFTNILKHSRATKARLAMSYRHSNFEIVVEDNGRGFDAAAQISQNGGGSEDGLRNMRDRLESVGGRCSVVSSPGRGTTVTFVLPVNTLSESQVKS